jgi:hypothetical protein
MAHSKAFVHPPLDLATDQIRLLSIQPGEPIRCTLEVYNPADQKEYIALSYTWGPESPKQNIAINGSEFSVRQNLFDFLVVGCRKHTGNLFWIDQICIDQSNTGERNHQVMRMSQIYKDASCVYSWLGAEADNSDEAMDFIEKLSQRRNDTWLHLKSTHSKQNMIGALLDRPYWRRLWIVQEVVLARRVIVLCGLLQTPFGSFESLAFNLRRLNHLMPNLLRPTHHLTCLLAMQITGDSYLRGDVIASSILLFLKSHDIQDQHDVELMMVNFRQKVYHCRKFECADPRDKIWGLAGLYPDGPKRLQIDYNKTTFEVFWDFFTSHLRGINHDMIIEGFRHNFHTRYALEDWWQYAQELMSHMNLYSHPFIARVAQLLEETFQELQTAWLARGSLDPENEVDISAFFAERLRCENVTAFVSGHHLLPYSIQLADIA